jgi:alkylated DNA repair dioxygenase AlkB
MKIVFSASFGQERVFRIINKKTLNPVKDIIMKDRTFMIMCGDTQKEFLHTVLQDTTQNKRLNITFRIT